MRSLKFKKLDPFLEGEIFLKGTTAFNYVHYEQRCINSKFKNSM